MNFNGLYYRHHLLMNLEDWFMQAYCNARGLNAASAPRDLVFKDYKARMPASGATGNIDLVRRNAAWFAMTQATPETRP